ncbi:MAG TPA: AAA family ATPase [Woeseiaceae bacterium]|nr:AAA family ATPase [Woeseiaceae bacterium]
MYTSFFGLREKPFSITPDPRYLFMSERHGEALAHLVYGVTESGGFMQLTGEVGTGKTTLVRTLLQNRLPDNADVAVVLNPQLSALEFLQTIAEELGVPEPKETNSIKALIDALNQHLLRAHAEGRRTIVVVDEAQNLSRDVLEQVRLLTNLETSKQKLLQIVLIGQPELRDLLARNDLRQLAQRITGRYHLEPLSREETAKYIDHRLRVAGAVGELFDPGARKAVYRLSQGVPRLINVICDRALLGAYGRESRRVSAPMVRRAAAEIAGTPWTAPGRRWLWPAGLAAVAAVVGVGAFAVYEQQRGPEQQGVAAAESATVDPATLDPATVDPATADRTTADAASVDPAAGAPEPGQEPAVAALTEPAAEAVLAPTLDYELQMAGDLTDTSTALASLFGTWGLPPEAAPRDCAAAALEGYECVHQRGSWTSLRQYDRPAILTLTDSTGATHDVLLAAIDGTRAELSIGGVAVEHSIDEISDLWFGQFLLVWRPANGEVVALVPGLAHPNVAWLRQSLAAIDDSYRAEPLDSVRYDAPLTERVRAFQRDHRLLVDGLAGRQTQMIVNSLTGNVPRLTAPLLAQD